MQLKKLAILGGIGLIVLGCIVAAGCTSTPPQTGSADSVIGAWSFNVEDGSVVVVYNIDGTGYYVKLADEQFTRLTAYDQFTWKMIAEDTMKVTFSGELAPLLMTFSGEKAPLTVTYDAAKDALIDSTSKACAFRMDPVTGIWFAEGLDGITGKQAKFSTTVRNDGTGILNMEFADGTTAGEELVWMKQGDGTYVFQYADGDETVWKLDRDTALVSTKDGDLEATKRFADSYYYLSVLGPWYDVENDYLTHFNADGSGTIYKGTSGDKVVFTWEIPEFGSFLINTSSGAHVWTYDRVNDVFNIEDVAVAVRPSSLSDTSRFMGFDPIVGPWTTKVIQDGKTLDVIFYLNAVHGGAWMTIADKPNLVLSPCTLDTWKKTGTNTYEFQASDGKTYKATYDAEQDILVQDDGLTYTRADPFIGIWSGTSVGKEGSRTTAIYKPDGTGSGNVYNPFTGTSEYSTLTWKKNADGTYAVDYSNGEKRIYTLSPSALRMLSSSGTVKSNDFIDTTYLMSVTGPWYNKETGRVAVFNGDGTGAYIIGNDIAPFTWKVTGLGKWNITYISGVSTTESSGIAGKTYEWTYDRLADSFTDGSGVTFVRPTESVDGKIILF